MLGAKERARRRSASYAAQASDRATTQIGLFQQPAAKESSERRLAAMCCAVGVASAITVSCAGTATLVGERTGVADEEPADRVGLAVRIDHGHRGDRRPMRRRALHAAVCERMSRIVDTRTPRSPGRLRSCASLRDGDDVVVGQEDLLSTGGEELLSQAFSIASSGLQSSSLASEAGG